MATVQPITAQQTGKLAALLQQEGKGQDDFQLLLESGNHRRVCQLIDELTGKLRPVLTGPWVDELIAAEQARWQGTDLSPAREILGRYTQAQFERWVDELGLRVVICPGRVFARETEFPGWQTKPSDWFWEQLAAGKLLRSGLPAYDYRAQFPQVITQVGFEAGVYLLDPRCKPAFKNGGKQMWAGDKPFMGSLIEGLRKDGKLALYEYGPQASRFGISSLEWDEVLRPALAVHLGLEHHQVRLETALEMNVLPQLYPELPRRRDGQTNTWVLLEEYCEGASSRLCGGDADSGGLARVGWDGVRVRWGGQSVRPLGVLGTWKTEA